ncbi:MAG: T9SS type A sorting domain-containing protein, partial [Ginsengibacter sp.]
RIVSSLSPNNIFYGGAGDGFNLANANVMGNSIFKGGSGDGWNTTNLGSLPNAIFSGGIGDGWSKVIYPLGPLPVTLLSFTGEQQGKSNLLKWTTSQEVNTAYFEIERSTSANIYTKLQTVLASGNSTTLLSYLFLDVQPMTGNNFYRLKLVDADGKFVYSNTVLLRVSDDLLLSVFPNPTADKLNISINSTQNFAQLKLFVFDNSGKIISQQVEANNTIILDVSKYPAGVYFLKILFGDKEETMRFVKSH